MTLPVNPEPAIDDPGRMPPTPLDEPIQPVKEPEPERMPDETPLPNPDENPQPPQHVAGR